MVPTLSVEYTVREDRPACNIRTIKQTLLGVGLLEVSRPRAAAAGQLHGGNDDGAVFIHVEDMHQFLGGGLTTWHLERDKERRSKARFDIHTAENAQD